MKAKALTVHWHLENQPIYSAHFQPSADGKNKRLATGGGDNNVRIWKLEYDDEGNVETVRYLSTLSRHSQAVNAVRFDPKGNILASAGDDGTILLWALSDVVTKEFGASDEDVETWKLRHACRSSVSEVYDIAWSPDSQYIIAGSMDNIARIYNASNGQCIRQLAEHSHYVQGVAWDPLNEYIATQSSDRSVHIYALKTKDGAFTLHNHQKISRADLQSKKLTSGSPTTEHATLATTGANQKSSSTATHHNRRESFDHPGSSSAIAQSPSGGGNSTPGTPRSNMNPPPPVSRSHSHSRKSSFSSSVNRSESPSPAIPLPAVRQLGSPSLDNGSGPPVASSSPILNKGLMSYHNEAFTSFFRRLTFTPDGSLLFTPSGLYKYQDSVGNGNNNQHQESSSVVSEETTNTVYIYTRGGLNRPPVAHLPGLKKPSLAVKCSPILYKLRDDVDSQSSSKKTKHISIDSSSQTTPSLSLPESLVDEDSNKKKHRRSSSLNSPVFKLQYRIIYAVATQDSVIVYDTQQTAPLCVVSNLHYSAFTDLAWSNDGSTLLMTSSDGFCSVIVFQKDELGEIYDSSLQTNPVSDAQASATTTSNMDSSSEPSSLTPVVSNVPPVMAVGGQASLTPPGTPSATSTATLAGHSAHQQQNAMKRPPPPSSSSTKSDTASNSITTPSTGGSGSEDNSGNNNTDGVKKKRRIQPTLVTEKKDGNNDE